MKKIPTALVRDPENMSRVLMEITPGCEWVFDGSVLTQVSHKFDGTCTMFRDGTWWVRREVKPGKAEPPNWVEVDNDQITHKRMGWEPYEQSGFVKFIEEALTNLYGLIDHWRPGSAGVVMPVSGGTYELIGPKINGNPEKCDQHVLVRHGYMSYEDRLALDSLPVSDLDGIREWLLAHSDWEGVVYKHPIDGRMAKLKGRDFK